MNTACWAYNKMPEPHYNILQFYVISNTRKPKKAAKNMQSFGTKP